MSKKDDYTAEEWKSITAAPFLAGLYVTMADPSGLVGVAKEAMAIGRVISDSRAGHASEVVMSLAESLEAGGFSARPQLPDIPRHDLGAARAAMVEHLDKAITTIAAKSPVEADAFRVWLMTAARKAAEAAKEGGFLGFGGTLVSDQEQAAMTELAAKLGVKG
jgi:hypothetical protein